MVASPRAWFILFVFSLALYLSGCVTPAATAVLKPEEERQLVDDLAVSLDDISLFRCKVALRALDRKSGDDFTASASRFEQALKKRRELGSLAPEPTTTWLVREPLDDLAFKCLNVQNHFQFTGKGASN